MRATKAYNCEIRQIIPPTPGSVGRSFLPRKEGDMPPTPPANNERHDFCSVPAHWRTFTSDVFAITGSVSTPVAHMETASGSYSIILGHTRPKSQFVVDIKSAYGISTFASFRPYTEANTSVGCSLRDLHPLKAPMARSWPAIYSTCGEQTYLLGFIHPLFIVRSQPQRLASKCMVKFSRKPYDLR